MSARRPPSSGNLRRGAISTKPPAMRRKDPSTAETASSGERSSTTSLSERKRVTADDLTTVSCPSRGEVDRDAYWRPARVVAATQRRTRDDRKRRDAGRPTWRGSLRALGPGLVTGASDDDPSGIATYTQAGASFGFGLLWTALITFPLMAGVQEICDRTALATGKGLGQLATERLSHWGRRIVIALVGLLIVANALNIAADLVAVGSGMRLLHAGPSALWAVVAGAAISTLLVTGSFELVARAFKLLCLALFSYIAMLFVVNVNWGSVAHSTFVPHLSVSSSYVALLVAVLGTTISPYLFFWQ